MKKLSLLFAMIVFVCANAFAQSMYFDFNDCPAGAKIAQTLGDPWTTWSNAPGGSEDGVFGEAGGTMAAHFTYGNDQVLLLGGIESGVFDLVFDAYVPNGKCGYFNVLHHFAGSGSTWAAQFYLCATNDGNSSTVVGEGHGTVHAGSNGTADIPCVWDQWMQYRVHIDMDNDLATLFWNIAGQPEQEICSWQWSLDSFGSNVVGRTLDAMDFYPPSNGAEYYVDNIGIVSGADDQVLIDDDFEAYPIGGKIAQSAQAIGNDWWTTWTNAPGGNEDGVIAEAGGTKCGYISGANDNVLLLGGQESGAYNLEFAIYCVAGKYGYFNILHEFNGSGSTWAMQAYLNATNDGNSTTTYSVGHGTVHAGANGNGDIPAVVDEWMFFRIYVDCDLDVAELYYRSETTHPTEQLVVSWQWSLDSFGENVVGRKMDAMDFYAPHSTLGCYYLDNFLYTRIGQETHSSLQFDTDEVVAYLPEDEADAFDITISNANGTSIGDWTGWIDFGTTSVNTGSNQLSYDLDPDETTGANIALVGLNIDEPELIEVGALFPGSAYAGSAMGVKIVSAQYAIYEGESSGLGIQANTPLTFRVYGQGMYGQPGEVLAEKVIPYNSIVANGWTVATFDTPVDLTGYNVWVTVEFTQAVSGYPMCFDEGPNSGYGDYYRTNGGGAFNRCSETFSTDYGNFHIRMNTQGTPVPASWATLSKPEGSMAIGESDVVTVNVNSIGLNNGDTYEAMINFITNDPENPIVRIPLSLAVSPTSVSESAKDAYEVYPNPASSQVTVKGENLSSLAIYNVAGQLVRIVRLDSIVNTIDWGLYGRVTLPIYLSPFTLYECREFFMADGLHFDQFDICQAYIAFGGIPFYLDQFRKGLSLAQNIDAILYDVNAPLKEEFDRLFTSQFSSPDELQRIVTTLATKRIGFTRDELVKQGKFSSGGTLTENLAALQKSRLIMEYIPFGESTARYKVADPFCIFYLSHVRGNTDNPSYWQTHEKSPSVISWMGFAFEDLCWTHIRQIKHALGIDGVITKESPWNTLSDFKIDLIINRDDRFVCLCEMKFTRGDFEVTKSYNKTLLERMERVQEIVGDKKTVMSVLVTTYGLKRNEYAARFDKIVTMEDLFQN